MYTPRVSVIALRFHACARDDNYFSFYPPPRWWPCPAPLLSTRACYELVRKKIITLINTSINNKYPAQDEIEREREREGGMGRGRRGGERIEIPHGVFSS